MSEAAHLVYREIPVISMSNSKALTSLSVSSQRAVMAESPLANVLQSLMRQSSRRFPLFHMQPTPSLSIPRKNAKTHSDFAETAMTLGGSYSWGAA